MNTSRIIDRFLPANDNNYFAENTNKIRVCLHHTVSNPLCQAGDIATFIATRNVATQYIIGGNGEILRLFPNNFWAHHLGLRTANNTQMNRETIGIELDAWGPLTFKNGKYFNAYNRELTGNCKIEKLAKPFRKFTFFTEYTDAQIDSLAFLLKFLHVEHKIPMEGLNRTLNFEVCDFQRPGIYSHSNFRADKSDVYPATKLIGMLKML
jgi:N-acetyl-anhydromuramyl-L-alanine amidase AmpD